MRWLVEAAYVGSQGRDTVIKVDINQAPPVVGVTDANVNRPFIGTAPGIRGLSQSQSIGTLDHHAAPAEVPATLREPLLVHELVHVWEVDGLRVRQRGRHHQHVRLGYNYGPADCDVTHTFSSNWIYEIPCAREKLYGGWQFNGLLYLLSIVGFDSLPSHTRSGRLPVPVDCTKFGRPVHLARIATGIDPSPVVFILLSAGTTPEEGTRRR